MALAEDYQTRQRQTWKIPLISGIIISIYKEANQRLIIHDFRIEQDNTIFKLYRFQESDLDDITFDHQYDGTQPPYIVSTNFVT